MIHRFRVILKEFVNKICNQNLILYNKTYIILTNLSVFFFLIFVLGRKSQQFSIMSAVIIEIGL